MKLYPCRQLTNERRIYNYGISRGRKSVECSLGIIASKFRLLETPVHCCINNIDCIVQALCILRNFIWIYDGYFIEPVIEQNKSYYHQEQVNHNQSNLNNQRPTIAVNLRNCLCNFFSFIHYYGKTNTLSKNVLNTHYN